MQLQPLAAPVEQGSREGHSFCTDQSPNFALAGFCHYVLLASSMLLRGVDALRDFAVPSRDAGQLQVTLRDLRTSDTSLGNHLYKGDGTVVFILIGVVFAAAFGWLAVTPPRA